MNVLYRLQQQGILLLFFVCLTACNNLKEDITIKHGDVESIIYVNASKKYLLFPVEESSRESKIDVIVEDEIVGTQHIRLADTKVDYWVPMDLQKYKNRRVVVNVSQAVDSSICWDEFQLSDTFEVGNREKFRPLYHHTPAYGWMNDPNGMVYKDGEYHLFYQYNPYGSTWGNMHWGHAVSRDLSHWEHLPNAIAPDFLGTIFSGSAVVDRENVAGFGKDAIVAFFTSAGDRQVQSMAYSTDNGRTFVKYDQNPILTSTVRDFRDPKVFYHTPTQKWIMILAAGQEMQIYSSANLKDWTMQSTFGDEQGAHGGVWECPDLFELPVDGDTTNRKWVLICSLNPGGPLGGSATQYFTGSFDGKQFVNESDPQTVKWMDWGKDHYATVTWSDAPQNRRIALAWMSNWEYANDVPTLQYRSANTVPRELSLFSKGKETYLACRPVPELKAIRVQEKQLPAFRVSDTYNLDSLVNGNDGAYEIQLNLQKIDADIIGFKLYNNQGEYVDCTINIPEKKLLMDRRHSGKTDFSNDFPVVTQAPVDKAENYTFHLYMDKSSIECFVDEGQIAMTNLVFPTEPYNQINFYAKGGTFVVDGLHVYKLDNDSTK